MKKKYFFASLKLMKEGVGSRIGSGSGSAPKRHGSPILLTVLQWQRTSASYTVPTVGGIDSQPVLRIRITLMRIRIWVLLGTFDADADPDPTFHFDAEADPEPTFHFHADADPDPSFQITAQNLERVLK